MSHQTIIPPVAAVQWPVGPYASVGSRFIAWCIDRTIIDCTLFLLAVPFMLTTIMGSALAFPLLVPVGGFIGLSASGIWLFVDWVYFAAFESSARGATPGKRIMKLRVTDCGGQQISFWRASLRYASKILSALPMMMGYALALFTSKHQALHDLIAETVVLKLNS